MRLCFAVQGFHKNTAYRSYNCKNVQNYNVFNCRIYTYNLYLNKN